MNSSTEPSTSFSDHHDISFITPLKLMRMVLRIAKEIEIRKKVEEELALLLARRTES